MAVPPQGGTGGTAQRGALPGAGTEPSLAERQRKQSEMFPRSVLHVAFSLLQAASGKTLFSFQFGFFSPEVSAASALPALHHFITIFPKRSRYPSTMEAPPNSLSRMQLRLSQ